MAVLCLLHIGFCVIPHVVNSALSHVKPGNVSVTHLLEFVIIMQRINAVKVVHVNLFSTYFISIVIVPIDGGRYALNLLRIIRINHRITVLVFGVNKALYDLITHRCKNVIGERISLFGVLIVHIGIIEFLGDSLGGFKVHTRFDEG